MQETHEQIRNMQIRIESLTAERDDALSYVSREKATSSRLHGEAERAKTELINVKAERDALKAEVERLRQWYTDSHRIIDEWDTKCSALKGELARLLGACDYAVGALTRADIPDDAIAKALSQAAEDARAEPPEQPDQPDMMGQGC